MGVIKDIEDYAAALKANEGKFREHAKGLKAQGRRTVTYADIQRFDKKVLDGADWNASLRDCHSADFSGLADKIFIRHCLSMFDVAKAAGLEVKW